MKAILILALCLAFIIGTHATCIAQISISARLSGSWRVNGVPYQIYDFTAMNAGTESITSMRAVITFPPTSYIGEAWNYEKSSYLMSNFGGAIVVGQTFSGAGFILIGGGPATINFTNVACGGALPTQAATQAPTQAPTLPPTACRASYTLIRRANGAFLENSVPSQIWDLVFTNIGSSPINELSISITPVQNTVVNQNNKWNLNFDANTLYKVQLFGSLQMAGATFSGAGFVIAGASNGVPPAIAIKEVKCN